VLDGFAIARSDVVGVMDADLSHPPELLPRLFRTIRRGNFDIVVASRYIRGGGTSAWSFGRRALSRVACILTRPLTPVRDSMSGFFLVRRDRLEDFRTSARGFKIGLELIVRSHPRRLAEVGYVFVGRSIGVSKMGLGEAVRFVKQLLSLYVHALTRAMARPRYVALGGASGTAEPSAASMTRTDRLGRPRSKPSSAPAIVSALQAPQSQARRRTC
jgi:dolichol-phosphate mannosyltransferase